MGGSNPLPIARRSLSVHCYFFILHPLQFRLSLRLIRVSNEIFAILVAYFSFFKLLQST